MRISEEEAKLLGLKQDSKGDWSVPSGAQSGRRSSEKVDSESNAPREVSKPKSPPLRPSKRQAKREVSVEGKYVIDVVAYGPQPRDPDNLSPKVMIDYLVSEGIIPDDSNKHVALVEKRFVIAEEEKTEIFIWEQEKFSLIQFIVQILKDTFMTAESKSCT